MTSHHIGKKETRERERERERVFITAAKTNRVNCSCCLLNDRETERNEDRGKRETEINPGAIIIGDSPSLFGTQARREKWERDTAAPVDY